MNKIKLIGLITILTAPQSVNAQNWPQNEQAYQQSANPQNWAGNAQGKLPPSVAPVQQPQQKNMPQVYAPNTNGQNYNGYRPNYNMPNPYPYYLPQVSYGQPGMMRNRQYYPRPNNRRPNNSGNNWGNNGGNNGGFPSFPDSNFNMPDMNMNNMPFMGNNGNNMPFMGNNGNNPMDKMSDFDMPSPSFNMPTMNFPSWN